MYVCMFFFFFCSFCSCFVCLYGIVLFVSSSSVLVVSFHSLFGFITYTAPFFYFYYLATHMPLLGGEAGEGCALTIYDICMLICPLSLSFFFMFSSSIVILSIFSIISLITISLFFPPSFHLYFIVIIIVSPNPNFQTNPTTSVPAIVNLVVGVSPLFVFFSVVMGVFIPIFFSPPVPGV